MTRRQITVTVISVIACTWKRSLCGYCALMQYYRFLLSFQQHELQLWVCNLLSPKGVDMFRLYTFLWLCTQILMVLRGKTLCNPTWAMWLDPNFRSYFFLKTGDDARGGKNTFYSGCGMSTRCKDLQKKNSSLAGLFLRFYKKTNVMWTHTEIVEARSEQRRRRLDSKRVLEVARRAAEKTSAASLVKTRLQWL